MAKQLESRYRGSGPPNVARKSFLLLGLRDYIGQGILQCRPLMKEGALGAFCGEMEARIRRRGYHRA
jgi:hypothetical protein